MIKVEVRKPRKLHKEDQSLFISFPYSLHRLQLVKSLPVRYYNPDTKEWEVPAKDLNLVVNTFKNEQVEINANTQPSKQPDVTDVSELHLKTKPFKHQVEGILHGLRTDKFLLADEQGLGKTKQAIDIAVNRKLKEGFKHCLIVCGVNSLKWNWVNEIKLHSNEGVHILGTRVNTRGKVREGSLKDRLEDLQNGRDEFFLITNIESLRKPQQKKRVNGKMQDIELSETQKTQLAIINEIEKMTKDGTIGMVIFDEIHKAKNAQSQQGEAIHHLKSPYKIALTGTPLMNNPIDLYNILKWLDAERNSFYGFRNRYCIMGGYGGYEIVGYKNLKELQMKLDNVMLRRKKEDVLDLPPKIRQIEYVEMTAKQKQIYTDVLRGVRENLADIKLSPNPLAQLVRLRQATSHTGIISNTVQESAKFDRMKEIIEELVESNQKAIVFSNWTEVTDRALKELQDYNPAYITGDVKNRQAQVEKFQNDDSCKVIIGTISAMGTGLTLTAASTVIFLDKPWNPANTVQAEDRAHRIGTSGTVNIITLVCKDTIDERIEEIIYEKSELSEGLVEGDDEVLRKFDAGQLVDMLLT